MKEVIDRSVQYPNRYSLRDISTGRAVAIYDLVPFPGEIISEGTPIDRELFESIAKDFNGLQGPAGTIKIGTVTKLAPTATPTVSNSGTPAQAVLNFGIPQGAPGEQGYEGVGIESYEVAYQQSTNGVLIPQGKWQEEIPSVKQGNYLWTRTKIDLTDGRQISIYSVSYFAKDVSVDLENYVAIDTEFTDFKVKSKTFTVSGTDFIIDELGLAVAKQDGGAALIELNVNTDTPFMRIYDKSGEETMYERKSIRYDGNVLDFPSKGGTIAVLNDLDNKLSRDGGNLTGSPVLANNVALKGTYNGTDYGLLRINTSGNVVVGDISTPNKRVYIGGSALPNTNTSTFDLGNSSNKWNDLYLAGKIINNSGAEITLPTKAGTLALTSDVPDTSQFITTSGTTTLDGGKVFLVKKDNYSFAVNFDVINKNVNIRSAAGRIICDIDNAQVSIFDFTHGINTYYRPTEIQILDNVLTFPNGSGTFARIEDLEKYVRASADNSIVLGNANITSLQCAVSSITSLSDERTKEDIELANTAQCLADVERLPVHRFKFKKYARPNPKDEHVTEFIAQEVAQVFPKSVHMFDEDFPELDENGEPIMIYEVDKNGNYVYAVIGADEEGNLIYADEPNKVEKKFTMKNVMHIDRNFAIPTMWAAIQELSKQVKELKLLLSKNYD